MGHYLGEKINKPIKTQEDYDKYSSMAHFCNENGYYMKDNENDYEIAAFPAPSIQELRERKIDEFKTIRNTKEKEPVTTDKGTFDFDDDARDRITGAMSVLADTSITLDWTLADNTVVTVDYNDLKAVVIAAAIRCNELHEKYRTLRDRVNAAQTKEEIDAIVWE